MDAHAHVFPDMAGASGHPSAERHLANQQGRIRSWWGRMNSSTMDDAFMPLPGEAIDFRAGRFGRYYWRKSGRDAWLQRFPLSMETMEWSPERMIACMDAVGVDVAVLQAGYMEPRFCETYFDDCANRYPGRFAITITIDYDPRKGRAHLADEIHRLEAAVSERRARGVYQGFPKGLPFDEPEFDPLWRCLARLRIPHILLTGFEPKATYLESIERLGKVLSRHPELRVVIGHLGGNVRHPSSPEFTNTPEDLMPVLRHPNTYFEVGYALAYENREIWGRDYEYPYPLHTGLVRRVYEEVGADRLLWGSDMPNIERTCSYLQCLDLVRLHCTFLSPRELERVLCHNAAGLFALDLPALAEALPA